MSQNKLKLESIELKGYKSINREGQTIKFQDVTVFLGANGSGKSNLISFFSMINFMMTGNLQSYIGENGYANSILHYGLKITSRIEAIIKFSNDSEEDYYKFILSHAANDILIFNEETIIWQQKNKKHPFTLTLDAGLKESGLYKKSRERNRNSKALKIIYLLLSNCKVFQFHDTSKTSRIRNNSYLEDNKYLRSDGGNLAAFLYMLQHSHEKYYKRIVRYIKLIMPQFGDFALSPSLLNDNYVKLNWKENNSDYLFGPHQISDGSIRFMCLATLLLQPPDFLPSVIILDEPELGLHPSAISILSGMCKTASQNCQVVLATQSPRLVDEFEAENIVIVERNEQNNFSEYHVLDEEKLKEWLEQYSLSELWEKNVFGARP